MPRYAVLAPGSRERPSPGPDAAALLVLGPDLEPEGPAESVPLARLPEAAVRLEAEGVRWVWERTADWYPRLLAAGTGVARAHDLALCRAILAHSSAALPTPYVEGLRAAPPAPEGAPVPDRQDTLFAAAPAGAATVEDAAVELGNQLVAAPAGPGGRRLVLLLAAESVGGLVAAEMRHAGLPWDSAAHARLLECELGPRPAGGGLPPRLREAADRLRAALGAPGLNPDSQQDLLRALHRAGIDVRSTGQRELAGHHHPAVPVLLEYRRLARLHSANGWAWLDEWVRDGRFRTDYVVGGVPTGRWASRGGGALQIPHAVRPAVRADPGHVFVVADAAQLEPRILAALARDAALAGAARGRDLYRGVAETGFGGERAQAKVALLGALYGATTGESGRLYPRLARSFPRAVGFVEAAARDGEAGRTVTTLLGRSTPPPGEAWLARQRTASAEEQRRADAEARARGRFTRNFVVQGTAAEWALCWLGALRRRLRDERAAGRDAGELVFFLHDEVVLHVPRASAARAADLVRAAAAEAARLLFGDAPVQFPVECAAVGCYADAKGGAGGGGGADAAVAVDDGGAPAGDDGGARVAGPAAGREPA